MSLERRAQRIRHGLVGQHASRRDRLSLAIDELSEFRGCGNASLDRGHAVGRQRSVSQGGQLGDLVFAQPREHVAHSLRR